LKSSAKREIETAYPELKAATFKDIFSLIGVKGENLRI
jgi:hypothetical protein